ncbi:MAG: hydantoinase/oxoprolinase family protein [Pseudomonadota bacterium]|nr:hydantoinase/oxoprolinase family protein [Pseudomonadota bacterium]
MILGIDVGGTHTDAVLIEGFKIRKKAKIPTDAAHLLNSLLQVATEILAGEDPGKLQRVVLSTTLSTNAIVQDKVERVGMVVAGGPGLSPELLPRIPHTFHVAGYVNHRGEIIAEIDREEIAAVGEKLRREGIGRLGIVGKFSTRNPAQEEQAAAILSKDFGHASLGHRMSGRLNFRRRIETAYLNSAVWDIHQRFVTDVLQFVRGQGIEAPIYILKADGGTFDLAGSADYPVQTILSGPAASIMGILGMTKYDDDAVALDIGGTTTDIAVFADGAPLLENLGVTIEGHKTLIRGLRTRSIGLGGDSAVRYEEGQLRVGPQREGPAAALGGPLPTVTDAMIVLKRTALGDENLAAAALAPLAERMGRSVADTAEIIFAEACGKIAGAVRSFVEEINNEPVYTIHEMLEGKVIAPKILHVMGGPALAMADPLGEMLACRPVIPPHSEVANAVGAALARTTAEVSILADTERRRLTIGEEGTQMEIPSRYTMAQAIAVGEEKLREKALAMGARKEDLEIEVVESQEFNMVRDMYMAGKNIRVKVQIKPGLISGFARGQSL